MAPLSVFPRTRCNWRGSETNRSVTYTDSAAINFSLKRLKCIGGYYLNERLIKMIRKLGLDRTGSPRFSGCLSTCSVRYVAECTEPLGPPALDDLAWLTRRLHLVLQVHHPDRSHAAIKMAALETWEGGGLELHCAAGPSRLFDQSSIQTSRFSYRRMGRTVMLFFYYYY